MRHERAAALLSDYLDGALSGRVAARFEAHLLECAGCQRSLGELRRTAELLRGLRGSVEAPDLAPLVLARVRAGEAEPSAFERVRAGMSRFLAGPLGAPLATAAIGLTLLAVLPRIEVEVSIPGRSTRPIESSADLAPLAAHRSLPGPRFAGTPLAALRVNQSFVRAPSPFARSTPVICFEAASAEGCREHHAFMTKLAMEDAREFMAQLEEVPEPSRDAYLAAISRYAFESGTAPDVAAHLRATGDPRAQRVAARFEQAR